MITLRVDGWFQCRLATDPDPSDEARGVSGWTFAVPGEPPLDRIIRTQAVRTVVRKHGPQVGVAVREVSVDGVVQPAHLLCGANFELLGDPVFEGRNGLASEDTEEPIWPFHFRIRKGEVTIEGQHRDRLSGNWVFERAAGIEPISERVQAASQTADARAFWLARRAALEADLTTTHSELEREALAWRLAPIANALDAGEDEPVVGAVPLDAGLRYSYQFNGPWQWTNVPGARASGWSVRLWVGCWDADALCGFMDGQVDLPGTSD